MMTGLRACHCCGLIHRVPALEEGHAATCSRCQSTVARHGGSRATMGRTAAAALGAFILFWPAILLPLIEIEKLGHRHATSLVAGVYELMHQGEWVVGVVVLVFSVVFPLAKIVLLLELSLWGVLHRRHKALTYRVMEHLGKWSMMDVLLLAFMVMLIKLGTLVEFHIGPAAIAFVLCVATSMIASILFDPHAIWEQDDER